MNNNIKQKLEIDTNDGVTLLDLDSDEVDKIKDCNFFIRVNELENRRYRLKTEIKSNSILGCYYGRE